MTPEQAYIEGFVKRASEYGFSEDEAAEILKKASRGDSAAKFLKTIAAKHPHIGKDPAGLISELGELAKHKGYAADNIAHSLGYAPQNEKFSGRATRDWLAEHIRKLKNSPSLEEDFLERLNHQNDFYKPMGEVTIQPSHPTRGGRVGDSFLPKALPENFSF